MQVTPPEMTFDPLQFRHVLGHFPTGVAVITAVEPDGTPVGMAVGSFTSVSLDPPLVAFLPDRSSSSFPRIRASGHFCVNVLAEDQEMVCRSFATSGTQKFAGVQWRAAGSGSPILDGVIAWIDCRIANVLPAGDHFIVLGEVLGLDVAAKPAPLLFFRGGYGAFTSPSLSAPAQPDLLAPLRLMDAARHEMEQLARTLGVECQATALVQDELVILGTAGSARGPEIDRVGLRMPYAPPFGTLFAAYGPPDVAEQWFARAAASEEPGNAAVYREMLERVRERGWSIALSSRAHVTFELALCELPVFDATTAQLEAVRDAAAAVGPSSHEPTELIDTESYRVRNISVPVLDPDRAVALMLTLIDLPQTMTGADVTDYLTAAKDAAARVSARIAGYA